MDTLDSVIRERLFFLRNEVAYLKRESRAVSGLHEYQADERLKRAVVRSLQLCVEACLDIGRRLIALHGFEYPQTNRDVFYILEREGVVSSSFLPRLLKMAAFRNIAVHDYIRIDDVQVYGILKRNLSDFEDFARAVQEYLLSNPERD